MPTTQRSISQTNLKTNISVNTPMSDCKFLSSSKHTLNSSHFKAENGKDKTKCIEKL